MNSRFPIIHTFRLVLGSDCSTIYINFWENWTDNVYFEHDFDYVYNYVVKVRHCSRCRFSKTTHTHVQADSSRLSLARRFLEKNITTLRYSTWNVSCVWCHACNVLQWFKETCWKHDMLYRLFCIGCVYILYFWNCSVVTSWYGERQHALQRITAGLTIS